MSLTNDQITAKNFQEFYAQIRPYLNGQVPPVFNKFSKSDLYSADEKIIGRWTDGKPLYQKTQSYPNTSVSTSWTNLDSSEFATSMGNLVSVSVINGLDTSAVYPNAQVYIRLNNGVIQKRFDSSATMNLTVTFRYTKTTDSSVEIGNDTDYSTTEKIVGQWIDGKPIYQKVFDLGSDVNIPYQSFYSTSIDASNMSAIISATGWYSTCVTVYNLMGNIADNVIKLQTDRNGRDAAVRYVCIQYTKTTD